MKTIDIKNCCNQVIFLNKKIIIKSLSVNVFAWNSKTAKIYVTFFSCYLCFSRHCTKIEMPRIKLMHTSLFLGTWLLRYLGSKYCDLDITRISKYFINIDFLTFTVSKRSLNILRWKKILMSDFVLIVSSFFSFLVYGVILSLLKWNLKIQFAYCIWIYFSIW